ncbi:heterokaryon incompatibility protein-domain-containing protein [Podospora aff. communis PSN243]|uniref:Heterokaryon incompatibility protein-domain-containing protein n=1 Tax=Podospora aff. communis PSN243 TaxID=3040156 RepID=A0AAV9GLW4_9PEZI|nr:heterokaryon incompatibility protein-domain-containing protein [Podospora aff. communis PSN243]
MVATRSQAATHGRQRRSTTKANNASNSPKHTLENTAHPRRTSLATRSLDTYQYQELQDGSRDIRLIDLLPGSGNDPVVLQIKHARLPEYTETVSTSHERTLQQVRATLPPDWMVFETLEGRLIFANDALELSTWTHPGDPASKVPVLTKPLNAPETPDFEALSYTWGSPRSRKAVFIQDPSSPGGKLTKLLVTKNLSIALQNLRLPSKIRTLWVDAICINQSNIPERNAQVQRMPRIYRLAHRVVIWIGPGSRQSKVAISTLSHLAAQVEVTRQGHTIGDPDATEKEWYHNNHDLPYPDHVWRAIHRLFQRVWFTRVWVVQEVNLAGTKAIVQCGSDTIPWVMFRQAVLCLSTKYNIPSQDLRSEIATIVGLAIYDGAASYMPLAMSIFNRECSDQRDRVFGLLGLMPPGLRSRMPADYGLDVGEVYKRATLAQIEHFGRLDALRVCDDAGYDDRAIEAPSWVPDLIMPPPAVESIRQQFSSGMSRCVTRLVGGDVLEVLGVQAGRIFSVEEVFSSFLGDGVEAIRSWSLPKLDTQMPHGGTFLDAFAMTICSMKVKERYPQQQRLPEFKEWREYCGDVILNGDQALEEKGRVSELYLSSVEHVLYQRKFFMTKEGYIGLGPLGLKEGDIISVLLGYDAPMLFRETSPNTYQVVGSALVYGLHDALSLLGPLPDHWSIRVRLDSVGDANLPRFFNMMTEVETDEDPRLPPLERWARLDVDRTGDDPEVFQKFRNTSTGEVVNFDPRMGADKMRCRGVALRAFQLV